MSAVEPIYIDTTAGLRQIVEEALQCAHVAIDTESDSFYHYREKICLVQMSYPVSGVQKDVLVDPLASTLDLAAITPLLEAKNVETVFHDVGYDLLLFKKHLGVAPQPVFDTMLALRLLGIKTFGLGAVLKERFALDLDKGLQKSDWSLRPLSREQRQYAANDTRHLLALRDILEAELKVRGRYGWFVEDCERLLHKQPADQRPEDDRFWATKGMRKLKGDELSVARALFALREEYGALWDRPPFRVFGNETLFVLAQDRPRDMQALKRVRGLGPKVMAVFGDKILKACQSPEAFAEQARVHKSAAELREAQINEERFDRWREQRKNLSATLGLDPEVLMSNATLWDLAKGMKPAEHADFAGWRAEVLLPNLTIPA